MHCGYNYHRSDVLHLSSHPIRGPMISVYSNNDYVHFDQLVKVVSATLFHYEDTLVFCVLLFFIHQLSPPTRI